MVKQDSKRTNNIDGPNKKKIIIWRIISLILFLAAIVGICYFFFLDDDESLNDTLCMIHIRIKDSYLNGSIIGMVLIGLAVGCYFGFRFNGYKEGNFWDHFILLIGMVDLGLFLLNVICYISLYIIALIGFGILKPILVTIVRIGGFIYHNHVLFPIVAASFCLSFFSFTLLQFFMRFTNYYRHILTFRVITRVSIFICLISLAVGFGVGIFNVFTFENEDVFLGVYLLALAVIFAVIILLGVGEGRTIMKDFHFLVYDRQNYLLYLRSFTFDKKEDALADDLNQLKLPVMKIGNPKTFFQKGIGETFYLPSVNWKKQLDYYISRAKYVFVVVDYTEGVLWEMFNHLEYVDKFLYYVEDRNKLEELLKKNMSQKIRDSVLMECFVKVLAKTEQKSFCFRIVGNKCFCADVDAVLKSLDNIELNHVACSFPLESSQLSVNLSEKTDNKEKSFKNRDSLRVVSRGMKAAMRTAFRSIVSGLAVVIEYVFVISLFAFGVGFIATAIYSFFDSYVSCSWPVRILLVVLGVVCLRKGVAIVREKIQNKKKSNRRRSSKK